MRIDTKKRSYSKCLNRKRDLKVCRKMTHYIWKKVKTVEFSEDRVEVNENVINIQDIFLVLEKKSCKTESYVQ